MAYATVDQLRTWMDLPASTGADDDFDALLGQLLDTATEAIDGHCDRRFGPTADDPDATVPPAVHTACLMLASRLWDRRKSPHGVLGTGELGVIRVTGVDRDVEQLLLPHRDVWGVT